MKKLTALALALIMAVTCFVGCGKTNNNENTGNEVVESNDVSGTESTENDKPQLKDVPVADIEAAIAELYGEEYTCNSEIPVEYLEETYGVKADWVAEYIGKMPMISFHIDTFIAIKASDGNADNVEAALSEYRDYYIENALQYPANEAKAKAIRVYRTGDYVFYICLGQLDLYEINEQYGPDEADAKALELAAANNQKAVDKIDELLTK